MTNSFAILCVVASFLPLMVDGLQCYHCMSSTSIDDCNKSKKTLTCPDVANRCANVLTEVDTETGSLKSYYWGCATEKMCEDAKEQFKVCKEFNKDKNQASCNVTCCPGNTCSAVSQSVAMVINPPLLFSCVFVLLGFNLKIH